MNRHDSDELLQPDELDLPVEVWDLLRGAPAVAGGATAGARRAKLATGTRIGRYRVGDLLGRGGAAVYRARDEETGREVALKVLDPTCGLDGERLAQIRREAEVLPRLRDPAIVEVLAFDQDGEYRFLVMELIEGSSLAGILARLRRLDSRVVTDEHLAILPRVEAAGHSPVDRGNREEAYARRVAAIGLVVARALETAHRAGIVHRDIKPANLMFTSGGRLKIVDFGLAEFRDDLEESATSPDPVGTLRYMAPERLRGGNLARDPSCDLYALGATLYEILTMRDVFSGDAVGSLAMKVLIEPPVSPRRLRSGVPVDLENVVLSCLEKDPRDRYPDAAALAVDLERFLRGEPVRPRRQRRREFAFPLRGLRDAMVAVASTVLVLLVLVGIVYSFVGADGGGSRVSARIAKEYRDLVWRGHEIILSGWTPHVARLQSGTRSAQANLLEAERCLRRAAELDPDRPEAWSELARVLARRSGRTSTDVRDVLLRALEASPTDPLALVQLARWHRHVKDYEAADAIAASLAAWKDPLALDWLKAWTAFDDCDWDEAIRRFEALLEQDKELFPGSLIEAQLARIAARFNTREFHDIDSELFSLVGRVQCSREAAILKAHVSLEEKRPEEVQGELLSWLGADLDIDAILDVASFWKERVHREMIERTLDLVPPSQRHHPHVRAWRAWLARLESPYSAAVELDELVETNPDDIMLLTLRGELWCDAGDPAKALAIFTEATERIPGSATLWYHRALEHWCFEEFDEAYEAFERSLALDVNPNALTYYGRVALEESVLAAEAGKPKRSEECRAKARAQFEKALDAFPWNFASLKYLVKILLREGDHAGVDRLLRDYEEEYPEYHAFHQLLSNFDPQRALELTLKEPPGYARDGWFERVIAMHRQLKKTNALPNFLRNHTSREDLLEALEAMYGVVDRATPTLRELSILRDLAARLREADASEPLGYVVGARATAKLLEEGRFRRARRRGRASAARRLDEANARREQEILLQKELREILATADPRHPGVWSPEVIRVLIGQRPSGRRADAADELLSEEVVPSEMRLPLLAELVACGDPERERRAIDELLRIAEERDLYPPGLCRVLGDSLARHRTPAERAEFWEGVSSRRQHDSEAACWYAEALLAVDARADGEKILVDVFPDIEDATLVYRIASWVTRGRDFEHQLAFWRGVETRLATRGERLVRDSVKRIRLHLEQILAASDSWRWSASDHGTFARGRIWLPEAFFLSGRRVSLRPVVEPTWLETREFAPGEQAVFAIPLPEGDYRLRIFTIVEEEHPAELESIAVEGARAQPQWSAESTCVRVLSFDAQVADGCLDVRFAVGDEPLRVAAIAVRRRPRKPSRDAPDGICRPLLSRTIARFEPGAIARRLLALEAENGPLVSGTWLALAAGLEREGSSVEKKAAFWREISAASASPVVRDLAAHYAEGGGEQRIRIDCGNTSSSAPGSWSPDRFAVAGFANAVSAAKTARVDLGETCVGHVEVDCQRLYETCRSAGRGPAVSYAIPLGPGSYDVRLYFTQLEGLDPEPNRFEVWIEGDRRQRPVWVFAKAGHRILRAVRLEFAAEVTDGLLEVTLATRWRFGARLFAIEVVPAGPDRSPATR